MVLPGGVTMAGDGVSVTFGSKFERRSGELELGVDEADISDVGVDVPELLAS